MTPGKMRTREHVLADLSVNYVERVAFRCGYAVQRNATADYGIDLYILTCAADGRVEEDMILVQLKATDHLTLVAGGSAASLRVETADVIGWSLQTLPVLLILYDARRDTAYWVDVQSWASQRQTTAADWRTRTVQVRIPLAARFNVPALRRIRREKNRGRRTDSGDGERV